MPISSRSSLRPPLGQTSLAARLAAPDQADQVGGTLKCQVCGSANLEELCHEPPHPRFLCLDCNSGLSSDGRPVLAAPDQADQVGDTQRGRVSVSALFFLVCGLLAIALQACLLADAVQRFLGWFA